MTTRTSQLIVRLVDKVSGPAARATAGLRQLLGASQATAVAARGTMAAARRDMAMVRQGADRMTTAISLPLALIGAMGAKTAYEFAKAGNNMQAVTRITTEQRKEIEKLAQELNEKFPSTVVDIMGAAFELGRAGLDFDQIMGGLEGTLQLGLAGDLALAEAADISTNILTAMRLPAKGADQVAASLQRVNDVLSYVATNSTTDTRLMGETFKYVGPMAAAAGMSIEQVGAASLIMAKNQIRGSEAGVAMRSALVRMVKPTKPMIAALERLNLNVKDFIKGGRQISGNDVVRSLAADGIDATDFEKKIDAALADPKLQKSTAAMTAAIASIVDEAGSTIDKAKLAEAITDTLTAAGSEVDLFGFAAALREKGADLGDIARIFDARQGARLITLLVGDLNKAFTDVSERAKGAAAEMSAARMAGVVGQVNALAAAWTNLHIAIAEAGVLKTAGEIIRGITENLKGLAAANPRMLEFGTYAAFAVAALIPLGMALSGLGGIVGVVVGGIGLLATALGIATAPAVLIIGLLGALGYAVWSNWDKLKEVASFYGDMIAKLGAKIGEGIVAFAEWGAGIVTSLGDAIKGAAVSLFDTGSQLLQSLWDGMKSKAGELLSWASGLAGRVGSAIKGAIGMGGGGDAGAGAGAAPPARARGGHVSRGTSYLVGEKRPEIFTAGQSGYISPRVPEGGPRHGAPPINFSPTINISGVVGSHREIFDLFERELSRRAGEYFRGLQGDVRLGWGY